MFTVGTNADHLIWDELPAYPAGVGVKESDEAILESG